MIPLRSEKYNLCFHEAEIFENKNEESGSSSLSSQTILFRRLIRDEMRVNELMSDVNLSDL